jgi:hypothetical protein
MNVVQAILKTDADDKFDLLSFVLSGCPNSQSSEPVACPLRVSACLIALRQEIWSALIYRRCFRLPVSSSFVHTYISDSNSLDVYDWTNRILVWCVHVLKFCFLDEDGSIGIQDRAARSEQLSALKSFEYSWNLQKPASFDPIYFQDPDPSVGRYFPQIWFTNQCQITGLQHMELGRIVLGSHESISQRIGIGVSAAQRARENTFRQSTRNICGLALSNPSSQPAMVTAGLAITLCGEYFDDAGEQTALLDLLETLQNDHAWPTKELASNLMKAWNHVEEAQN